MNKVISGYFDDAHRGLSRQQSGPAMATGAPASLQLPPLRPGSGPLPGNPPVPEGAPVAPGVGSGEDRDPNGWDKVMGFSLRESKSLASFDVSRAQASGEAEQYQNSLSENSRLSRRVRALQDQLAITSAKKEAFKAQAQRLEREFRKGREQADSLQKELLEGKRDAAQLSKEAQEAMAMMTEMRKAHIAEVKLLQRGLAARGGDDKMRNRVNEMADLVDKVGRSVVQRDEAIRDRTQMQSQLTKALKDLRSSADDCAKLKRQNKQLSDSLKEARRKGNYAPPRPSGAPAEDSDEEFEHELAQFEKRFEILEEGPAGLDVLASNLSKDKQDLEKRSKAQQDTIRSLNETIENWKNLGAQKDQQIKELSGKLERVLRDRAMFEEQISAKQRDIAEQVEQERAELEARIAELELEADSARSAADGMEKASTRLTKELVKVHEHFSGAPAETAQVTDFAQVAAAEGVQAKTGETLSMSVWKAGETVELRVCETTEEGAGEESKVRVDPAVVKELDEADPWNDLFRRAGIDPGPPRKAVVSTKLAMKEVTLQPSGNSVLLTAYQYSPKRFYIAGTDLASQAMLNFSISEANMTTELEDRIASCDDNEGIFDVLASALTLDDKGLALSASVVA